MFRLIEAMKTYWGDSFGAYKGGSDPVLQDDYADGEVLVEEEGSDEAPDLCDPDFELAAALGVPQNCIQAMSPSPVKPPAADAPPGESSAVDTKGDEDAQLGHAAVADQSANLSRKERIVQLKCLDRT